METVNPLDPLAASCEIESLRKKLSDALLQNNDLLGRVQHNYEVAQQAMKDRETAIIERNDALRLYNELVMLVVPHHLWISTGARIDEEHDDCETCAWLEKNTKFGEKSKTEKRIDPVPNCGKPFKHGEDRPGVVHVPMACGRQDGHDGPCGCA